MIDVIDLAGAPTVEDFEFRVGNDNDVTTWTDAPTPTSITVRSSAGLEGSDRIVLVWDDGTIAGKWLQVTMLSTPATVQPRFSSSARSRPGPMPASRMFPGPVPEL